jgi:crotonobetainyl-CoA:carnitine CoA-transferase CaiB-like acyl-CoA transferase
VDVAMADSILAMSELVVSQYSYRGISPVPVGSGIPGFAPFGTVNAKDGLIAIAAPHDPQWLQLCNLMGQPGLAQDERFKTEGARWENRVALYAMIEAFTLQHSKFDLLGIFGGKVPFSPINTAADIFADPHFAARNMLPQVDHPGSATLATVPGVPVKLSRTPGGVRQRAPRLGEHTREILAEIGLTAAAIDQLLGQGAAGAVATHA